MEINIPTEQDILRDIAIQYVNKAFVYITDCNPPLTVVEVNFAINVMFIIGMEL